LSYVCKECQRIPLVLGNVYGKQAKRVDLSYNSLVSLEGIESFVFLQELILDNNNLDDSVHFPANIHLRLLSLNKNQVRNIRNTYSHCFRLFEQFKNLDILLRKISVAYPNLTYLSLLGNDACPDQLTSTEKDDDDYKRYRYYVLFKLRNLQFLDSTKVKAADKREAMRIGRYMKVFRPSDDVVSLRCEGDDQNAQFTPLPISDDVDEPNTHRSAFGRLRYKYTGKHSEGNRFIRNHEL
ncbi:U2 small nuclear ribonucleoprotein A-like protein, partial [Leptotrombidium deliense]